jgi:uncharacterized protein YbbK (DUF523 family)
MKDREYRLRALGEAEVVLCSACLLGCRCRYDGTDKQDPRVEKALAGHEVVPICPEAAGGLPIPRPPADLSGGDGRKVLEGAARVVSSKGLDVTAQFARGADLALQAARRYGARAALMKEGSPSCGSGRICLDGRKVSGMGVAAAALDRAGIAIVSEEELPAPEEEPQ